MPATDTCSIIPCCPNREGDDFVTNLGTLAYVQDILVAHINWTALIMALEMDFGRVQVSATSRDSPNTAKKNGQTREWIK